MAKNRKNQSAAIRFGPALKATFLCLLIAGSAVGYVWQKSQIYQLGKLMRDKETGLARLKVENRRLEDQLADLRSVRMLDQRATSLGLAPAMPMQVVRLPEPVLEGPGIKHPPRQLAIRQSEETIQ